MSVLKSDNGEELIVTCKCGCDEGLHIRIERDDPAGILIPKMKRFAMQLTLIQIGIVTRVRKFGALFGINLEKSGPLSEAKIFIIQKLL